MPFAPLDDIQAATPVVPPTPKPAERQESPGLLDTAAAALRQTNIVSQTYDNFVNGAYSNYPVKPGYSAYTDPNELRGYEHRLSDFAASDSPEQTAMIKRRIDSEEADKRVMAESGWAGHAISLAGGLTDPMTLTMLALPGTEELAATRLGKALWSAGTGVAFGEVQAAALAANSQTTSYTDGIIPRIGVDALLAGVAGGMLARMPKSELDKVRADTREYLNRPQAESTAGAAQVANTTLHDETIAKGAWGVSALLTRTPGLRMLASPTLDIFMNSMVVKSRQLAQMLVDFSPKLNKNIEKGLETSASVENNTNVARNKRDIFTLQLLKEKYAEHKANGGTLSRDEFERAAAEASYNNDTHVVKEAADVARAHRAMFNADEADLVKFGYKAAAAQGKQVGRKSYFPFVYDQHAIAADRTGFENMIRDHFTANPLTDEKGNPVKDSPAEVNARVHESIQRIQDLPHGVADFGQDVSKPSVFKERAWDIPYDKLKPWLSHDYAHIMKAYNRGFVSRMEFEKMFPGGEFEAHLQDVRDQYNARIEKAPNDGIKDKLTKRLAADLSQLMLLKDKALNVTTGPTSNVARQMVRIGQLARSFNYIRSLGGQLLSALPDWPRLVSRYGLTNTGVRTAQFLANPEFRALALKDGQRMGTAGDVILHTRMESLDGTTLDGSGISKMMNNASANFTKISGIAHWDTFMRGMSSLLQQDDLHAVLHKANPTRWEIGQLANYGIGERHIPELRALFAKYGSNDAGLNRFRTELWTGSKAEIEHAERVEQAVQRAASNSAFYTGKGDVPGFSSSEIGKFMFQFKGFAMSSVNRLMLPLAQGVAHGDLRAVNGLISGIAFGSMVYYMKSLAAGVEPDMSPHNLIKEGMQRSGVLGMIPDLADPIMEALHLPRFQKFADRENTIASLILGPTGTMAQNMYDAVSRATKGQLTAKDMHKFRQLMPWNSLFYLQRLFNIAEGKLSDALGLKGAQGKPAADYLNPSKDEPFKEHPDKTHLFGVEEIPNSF